MAARSSLNAKNLEGLGASRLACLLILARPGQLHGGDERLMEEIASVLEGSQPLAATLCLRLIVEFILETGQSNSYSRAVRHLDGCRRLAAAINDWGRIPSHNSYILDLLRAYKHRTGFRNKIPVSQLLVEENPR